MSNLLQFLVLKSKEVFLRYETAKWCTGDKWLACDASFLYSFILCNLGWMTRCHHLDHYTNYSPDVKIFIVESSSNTITFCFNGVCYL